MNAYINQIDPELLFSKKEELKDSCIIKVDFFNNQIKRISVVFSSNVKFNKISMAAISHSINFPHNNSIKNNDSYYFPLKYRVGIGKPSIENGWVILELIKPNIDIQH